ncbi:MAG: hypothetical protein ABI743_13015, partial [bacterium]
MSDLLPPPLPPDPTDPDLSLDPVVAQATHGDASIGMVRDSVQTFAAQIINILMALIASAILGRAMAPTGKGLLAILILIPKSAWSFGNLGLDQVNTVYAGREPERRHELATTTLAFGIVISVFTCILVAVLLYWPGKGAAKVDVRPGDFIVAIAGQPVITADTTTNPIPASANTATTVPATVWRNGATHEVAIPVEEVPGSAAPLAERFRLSPLNMWRYGLSPNPHFAVTQYLPTLGIGVIPLAEPQWTELTERQTRGWLLDGATIPVAQPALLVTQVGSGNKLERLLGGGGEPRDLRVGDFIVQVDHQIPGPA